MSRVYISFLAACLAAAASASFAAHATAQRQSNAIAIDSVTPTEVAQAPDESAFKQMLIKGSPWTVVTESQRGTKWTSTYNFALGSDGATLAGKRYDSFNRPDGEVEKITIKKDCVSYVISFSDRAQENKYNCCLAADGTLKGTYEGVSSRGNAYTGGVVAKPAGR